MPDVVLHQWEISPFCGKVRKILRHKGIAFSVENYNGLRARRARRLSPGGRLPVLDWHGTRVADSSAIAMFVEQQVPTPSIYPADPQAAALARTYEDWAGTSLYQHGSYFRLEYAAPRAQAIALLCAGRPAWERALFGVAYRRQGQRRLEALGYMRRDGREIEAAYLRLIDDLDSTLRDRPWLVGEAPSVADFSVSAQLDEMLRTSTLADRMRLRAHVARWLKCLA